MKISPIKPASRLALRSLSFSTRFWLAQTAVALSLHAVHGQTVYRWDGGGADNNWSTPENWTTDTAPSNPTLPSPTADIIELAGTVQTTVNLNQPWTIDRLDFISNADLFTLGGSVLTLQPTNGTGHDSRYFIQNLSGKTQTVNNDLVILPAPNPTAPNLTQTGSGINVGNGGTLIFNGDLDFSAVKGSGVRVRGGNGTAIFNGEISGDFGDSFALNGGANAIFNHTNSFLSNFAVWGGTAKTTVDSLPGEAGAFGRASSAITLGHTSVALSANLLASAAVTIGREIQIAANGQQTRTIGGDTAHVSNFTATIYNGSSGAASSSVIVTAASGGRSNITGITRRDNASAESALADTVTKAGAGIVAFTQSSNYSGQTNVTAGTFLVNGTISPTSPNSTSVGDVVVQSGATLGGTGYIYRNTIIQDGAIFSPGDIDGSGTRLGGLLTVGVGLTFSENSLLQFDLADPSSFLDDEVSVDGGQLTLDGILNVTPLAGFGVGTYRLFGYSGTLVNNGLIIGSLPAGFAATVNVDEASSAVYLNVVPEPATGALLATAGALALLRRRRRA